MEKPPLFFPLFFELSSLVNRIIDLSIQSCFEGTYLANKFAVWELPHHHEIDIRGPVLFIFRIGTIDESQCNACISPDNLIQASFNALCLENNLLELLEKRVLLIELIQILGSQKFLLRCF